ncbi:MAG: Slp family lipoprotein [Nitrospiraceae bacterium]|nr:Slp family lipoprotein [Nitrospiraceae bacterium]
MKKAAPIIIALLLCSCVSPVIRQEYLKTGARNVGPDILASHPADYKGKTIILGGIIINTTVTDKESTIEALFVPVDQNGYLENTAGPGRYLVVWPRANGILDPLIYRRNRRITVAGTFVGTSEGKIGKASYTFPVIDALQIFLWETPRYYPAYYYPPYYYYGPYWYPYWGSRYYWWY